MNAKRVMDKINAASTVVMAFCTLIITVFTWQTTRIANNMLLIEQAPNIHVDNLRVGAALQFRITNIGEVPVKNIEIFERYYTTNLQLQDERPVGTRYAAPTNVVKELLPSASIDLHAQESRVFSILSQSINKGKRIAFVELRIQFRHGIKGNLVPHVLQFLILPSDNGWKLFAVNEELLRILPTLGERYDPSEKGDREVVAL